MWPENLDLDIHGNHANKAKLYIEQMSAQLKHYTQSIQKHIHTKITFLLHTNTVRMHI